jgi:membrane-associated protein
MDHLLSLLNDLPAHLAHWTQTMGPWIYVLLFAIIFSETGLVVFPFLPGDSLLFAVGALTAVEGALDLKISILTLVAAASLGDTSNYWIGRLLGRKLFTNSKSKLFNPKHLESTQDFYKRHGRRTIFLARFLPIFRTYAPFVAGLGRVPYAQFIASSLSGSIVWISLFITVGNRFGNLESVKRNFHFVIIGILIVSVIPIALEVVRSRQKSSGSKGANVP